MSETFDTLAAAQTLRDKGMDSGHAEGVVEVVRNAQSELATKADIKSVNDRIDALGENMRTEIKGLDGRIDSLGENMRIEMTALRQEIKAEIKALGQEMKAEMKVLSGRIDTTNGRIDTMRWLVGLNFTATMAAIAAIVVVAITLAAQ